MAVKEQLAETAGKKNIIDATIPVPERFDNFPPRTEPQLGRIMP